MTDTTVGIIPFQHFSFTCSSCVLSKFQPQKLHSRRGPPSSVFSSRFIDPQFLWRAQWMALTEWRPKGLMHPEKTPSAYPKEHSYWGTTTWIDLKHFIVEWAHFSIDTTLYLKFKMYIMLHRFEGPFFSKCTISIWLAVIIHMGRQYHGFI